MIELTFGEDIKYREFVYRGVKCDANHGRERLTKSTVGRAGVLECSLYAHILRDLGNLNTSFVASDFGTKP